MLAPVNSKITVVCWTWVDPLTLQLSTIEGGQSTRLRLFPNLSLFLPFSDGPSQPPLSLAFVLSLLDAHGTSMHCPKQGHSGLTNTPESSVHS